MEAQHNVHNSIIEDCHNGFIYLLTVQQFPEHNDQGLPLQLWRAVFADVNVYSCLIEDFVPNCNSKGRQIQWCDYKILFKRRNATFSEMEQNLTAIQINYLTNLKPSGMCDVKSTLNPWKSTI